MRHENMPDSTHFNKIAGCLFGGAAGDALGYCVEFSRLDKIIERYGAKGITEYALDKNSRLALISDDTQMTLFTANALLYRDTQQCVNGTSELPRQYAAMAYRDWLITQLRTYEQYKLCEQSHISWLMDVPQLYSTRAPGNTCITGIQTRRMNRVEDYINTPINSSKGCGGIMRAAPIALVPYTDTDSLAIESAQISAITHTHPLGYMSSSVFTHIINRIVFTSADNLKDIVIDARDTVGEIFKHDSYIIELKDIINHAIELSENNRSDMQNISELGEGWVAEETLAIAIYCALRHRNDFSAGIIAAVNHDGDSDSTGAVTGNILGALLGYDAIEEKWLKNLELSDVIMQMSKDLHCGCNLCEDIKDWKHRYIHFKYR